ncbi:MAG: hypothetical protein ACLQGP_03035 [Isosphaeraceae bacterium]
MGKQRGRPKTSERDDGTVRIDKALIARAKILAGYRGCSVAELLSDMLEKPIGQAYAQMVREMEGKGGGK